jgi:ATP-binding cassette subfamily B multidrug efflux pump
VTELLNHEPELVILSRGRQGRLSASPETLSLLERRGVPVVREKTAAALATYNPLAAERCRVAGHVQPAGSRTLPSRRPLPHHLLAVPDRCRRPRLQQGALFMTSRCACRWLTTTRHKKSSSAWASFGAQFVSGIIMPTMFFIGNLNYVLIAVVGGLRVASGTMNLGDVQAFIQYSRMFTQPLTQVASMANLLQSGVASAERVFEVLDVEEESADATGILTPTRGRVEFEHVSFSYERASTSSNGDDPLEPRDIEPLISDLSLVAEPGQTVAIVGPTGAGKTTLVNLIMRFYQLEGGRITLDGTDIASVPRAQLRSQIGMVLQDAWLFHGTIRENIAYGRPGASEQDIHAAAEATYVDRFVHSLSDGYDTVIDEEGSNISAGEKQLITIARAFLADPALLILDEATSSVDTRTEVLVQHAMSALRSDRTSFVIAHRLSTIRDADVILVMEAGQIVEQGTHHELLEVRGHYFDLYNSQFAGAIEDLTTV